MPRFPFSGVNYFKLLHKYLPPLSLTPPPPPAFSPDLIQTKTSSCSPANSPGLGQRQGRSCSPGWVQTPTSASFRGHKKKKKKKKENVDLNGLKCLTTSRHTAWFCSQVGAELIPAGLGPVPRSQNQPKAVGAGNYFPPNEFPSPDSCEGFSQEHVAACKAASSKQVKRRRFGPGISGATFPPCERAPWL